MAALRHAFTAVDGVQIELLGMQVHADVQQITRPAIFEIPLSSAMRVGRWLNFSYLSRQETRR
jgi:hypothetical protein